MYKLVSMALGSAWTLFSTSDCDTFARKSLVLINYSKIGNDVPVLLCRDYLFNPIYLQLLLCGDRSVCLV